MKADVINAPETRFLCAECHTLSFVIRTECAGELGFFCLECKRGVALHFGHPLHPAAPGIPQITDALATALRRAGGA